jgi:hypothetical protein
MAISPIDSSTTDVTSTSEAQFNTAVENSKSAEMTDDELTETLITQAVTIGGQFIIMPKAQEILNEAQSSDDEE